MAGPNGAFDQPFRVFCKQLEDIHDRLRAEAVTRDAFGDLQPAYPDFWVMPEGRRIKEERDAMDALLRRVIVGG